MLPCRPLGTGVVSKTLGIIIPPHPAQPLSASKYEGVVADTARVAALPCLRRAGSFQPAFRNIHSLYSGLPLLVATVRGRLLATLTVAMVAGFSSMPRQRSAAGALILAPKPPCACRPQPLFRSHQIQYPHPPVRSTRLSCRRFPLASPSLAYLLFRYETIYGQGKPALRKADVLLRAHRDVPMVELLGTHAGPAATL